MAGSVVDLFKQCQLPGVAEIGGCCLNVGKAKVHKLSLLISYVFASLKCRREKKLNVKHKSSVLFERFMFSTKSLFQLVTISSYTMLVF